MKQRILYLDVIRILACVMIIAMHAPIPNTGISNYVLSTDSFLTAPGIGLFIMVSGALLLPVNMSTEQFLKKRFSKIVWPTLFWTLFYYIVAPYTDTVDRGSGLTSFLSIPFSTQFNSVLWFMYMLAGLYLLAPVLSCWLKQASRREIVFYLCLWGITMCYPLIRDYVIVNESHMGILFYFGGYAGYFLLGYYLNKYVNLSIWKSLVLFVFPLLIAMIVKMSGTKVDFYDMFWYLSIFVAMMCIAWFMIVKRMRMTYDNYSQLHRAVVVVSNCCFSIYLVHIFIMRSLLWNWSFIQELSGILQIGIVTILTFVGSFLVTWLISYLPWADYLIGYKQKR